jgi:sporulation protein YlmC with PRC-barrel domain
MKRLLSYTTVALLLATGSAFAAEDADQSNAAQPSLIQPNAAQPEAAQPDAAQPNAAQSDDAQPNAAQSDTAQPNSQPEAAQPDLGAAQPDAVQPNVAPNVQAATPSEQRPSQPMSTSSSEDMAGGLASGALPISEYYNQSVYDDRDHKVGDVNDLLLDKDGKINAAIIGVGGFLGVGEKNVAVPFSSLKVAEKDGSRYLILETTKEALQSAPGYVYDSGKKVWMPAPKQG